MSERRACGCRKPDAALSAGAADDFAPKGAAAAVFDCETRAFDLSGGVPCYGPKAIRSAYGLAGLIKAGFTGAGQTIVIVDAFGSPTALADLKDFDKSFGLNDPPSFVVHTMPGTPAFDANDPNQIGWAEETSLDVQWSHAMAPRANIVLVAARATRTTTCWRRSTSRSTRSWATSSP